MERRDEKDEVPTPADFRAAVGEIGGMLHEAVVDLFEALIALVFAIVLALFMTCVLLPLDVARNLRWDWQNRKGAKR